MAADFSTRALSNHPPPPSLSPVLLLLARPLASWPPSTCGSILALEKALAEVSRSQREFSERGAELEEMDVHMEKAECAILEAEFRDDVR